MTAIITDLREFRHPGRRPSEDEMHARGLCDLQEIAAGGPARLPQICHDCRRNPYPEPLRFIPVDKDPKALARAYLYKAVCAFGCKEVR